jgi:hypothetical protein
MIASPMTHCRHCGADNSPTAKVCWICKSRLAAVSGDSTSGVSAVFAAARCRTDTAIRAISTLFISITAVAVGLGLATWQPLWAIGYGLLVIVPLVATIIAEFIGRWRGHEFGWRQRAVAFLMTALIIPVLLFALGLAAVIAVLIGCSIHSYMHPNPNWPGP